MTNIVPGDLVPVAMALTDIEDLNELCDILRKGRSEIMVDALREYMLTHRLHFELARIRQRNEKIRAELRSDYTIKIPPELL